MVPAGSEVTLADLAKQHNLTPQKVYQSATRDTKPAPIPLAEGGGYGRKTVQEMCESARRSDVDRTRAAATNMASRRRRPATSENSRQRPASGRIDIVKILQG